MSLNENLLLSTKKFEQQRTFWLQALDGLAVEPFLPRPRTGDLTAGELSGSEEHIVVLDTAVSWILEKLSKQDDLTLFVIVLAAYLVFLSKYSGRTDVYTAMPVLPQGTEPSNLNHVVALRQTLAPCMSFKEVLVALRQEFYTVLDNQDYPFGRVIRQLRFQDGESREGLLESLLAFKGLHRELDKDLDMSGNHLRILVDRNEGTVRLTFGYDPSDLTPASVVAIGNYFQRLLGNLLKNLDAPMNEIPLLDQRESRRLLEEFNATALDYPTDKTIQQLFRQQARQTPNRTALCIGNRQLTYGKLDDLSDRLAARVVEESQGRSSIVGLWLDRSLDMIIALLGILKAGCAYLPIDPQSPLDRAVFMLRDCDSRLLLSDHQRMTGVLAGLDGVGVIDIPLWLEEGNEAVHTLEKEISASAQDIAYIIYTSGSTGKPKGVAIEHRNVVNLVFSQWEIFNFAAGEERVMQFSSICFDASVEQIFLALFSGSLLVLMDRVTVLDPEALADAIDKHRVTHVHAVPSYLRQIEFRTLDSLKRMIAGGEVCPADLAKRWHATCDFFNEYGPTETTVTSIECNVDPKTAEQNVLPIGDPIGNTNVYLLNRDMSVAPTGVAADLYVGGDGVARGYLNRPELTHQAFVSDPFVDGRRLYRTGDLAMFAPDGKLYFMGRKDHQIKINGYRIEVGEIERVLHRHPAVKEAAVIPRPAEDRFLLCAFVVLMEQSSVNTVDALFEHLRRALPSYMIPAHIVPLAELPLLANGKLDRRGLEQLDVESESAVIPPENDTQRALVTIWARELGVEPERIGIERNFFELGGHSLKAIAIVSAAQKELGVKIPLEAIFKSPTVKQLSLLVDRTETADIVPLERAEQREDYTLSSAQKRLLVLQQLEPDGVAYNLPEMFRFQRKLDVEALNRTFQALIQRHEGLRTCFVEKDHQPRQKVLESVDFAVEVFTPAEGESYLDVMQRFVRSFDLAQAPLLRVAYIDLPEDGSILALDMHHIISDAQSHQVLMNDFKALERGEELPPLAYQYKDYSQWQQSAAMAKVLKGQEDYWLERMQGELPLLTLPCDYPRPAFQSFSGDSLVVPLNREVSDRLFRLASQQNATFFMLLLSVFSVFLAKLCRQEDIVIGTPVSGRVDNDLESIVGVFINTLPIRVFPEGNRSFADFFQEIQHSVMGALDNQLFPFEDLVERLALQRDMSRNPLLDVMFSLQEVSNKDGDQWLRDWRQNNYHHNISKFDLTLDVYAADRLNLVFEYADDLFKRTTIERFGGYIRQLIQSILREPETMIRDLDIVPETEKETLLYGFNHITPGSEIPETVDWFVHEAFARQAETQPDAVACVSLDHYVTYGALNEMSNRVTRRLVELGVGAGMVVGVMADPSIQLMASILGILKAGGAYLPMDPNYPRERVNYMAADSSIRWLLTDRLDTESLAAGVENLPIEDIVQSECSAAAVDTVVEPRQLAYVIFTSGSEGRPRGIGIEHHSFSDFVDWAIEIFGHKAGFRSLVSNSIAFDGSIQQIFPPLAAGGILYFIQRETRLEPERYLDFLQKHKINNIDEVPVVMNALCEAGPADETGDWLPHLTHLCLGSEYVPIETVRNCRRRLNQLGHIINAYGPAEVSVETTYYYFDGRDADERSLIGRPRQGLRIYILDTYDQIVPIGVAGEICISGVGLARGYMNRPELTRTKFCPNAHSGIPGDLMYRSGDLGRWLPDGNIDYLGRIDQQVKIRGIRIELEELEFLLKRYDAVRDAVVVSLGKITDQQGEVCDADTYLCAYVVARQSQNGDAPLANQLREYLSGKLPAGMIPSFFVELEQLPLSPNGKVDRRLLPLPQLSGGSETQAPRDLVEEKLIELWAQVLGLDAGSIGVEADFFLLGGHSLKATILVNMARKEFNVHCPLAELFSRPAIAEFAAYIRGAKRRIYDNIQPVEKREWYPQSSAQKRLFFLDQYESIGTAYNMPEILKINGFIDPERFENAVRQLIQRHEVLRTSFLFAYNEPVQIVQPTVDFHLERIVLKDETPTETVRAFTRPFDLSRAPLLRVGVASRGDSDHYLLYDIHHIVSDGTSMEILIEDCIGFYNGADMPPLDIHYKEFAVWQHQLASSGAIRMQQDYWRTVFPEHEALPRLSLKTDFPRTSQFIFEGDQFVFSVGDDAAAGFRALAAREGATLYMNLLAVFNVLLFKYTGQSDIIVGGATSGRQHSDFQKVIGFFINSLPMRNYPGAEKTYEDFLREVRRNSLNAFENQDLQFEELVSLLNINRDASRNPLFDVLFVLQNFERGQAAQGGMKDVSFSFVPNNATTAKFDIQLVAMELGEEIRLAIEYSTKLFHRSTISAMAGHFLEIVEQVACHPDILLNDISLDSALQDATVPAQLEDAGDFAL